MHELAATTILQPLFGSTCVSQHCQLRWFCWNSFTTGMSLLMATSTFALGSSPQWLPTLSPYHILAVIERVQAFADISCSVLCCHSNESRAPIANPPISAQLEGTLYHSRSCIRVHAVVLECSEDRQTHRQLWPLYISRHLDLHDVITYINGNN